MIRILQVVNDMRRAGLETMLMNYYRHLDRSRFQFDFLTHRPWPGDYDDEIRALGGQVYYAPRLYPQNYPAYFRFMEEFFREHPEYTIIHSHIDAMSYLPLAAAKKAGVTIRIAHSHNTAIDRDLKLPLKLLFRRLLPPTATHYWACGEEAGQFLFPGKDCTILYNAIEADRFRFDPQVRRQMRASLELGDALVFGHVGRLSYQKNHEFLFRVFAEVHKTRPEALLLVIGTGEKEEALRRLAQELGLGGHIRFLGNRGDVDKLYQAMDFFLLPSWFEGVPLTGIEAQFAGLPCFFSDRVPREVAFTDRCSFLSLELSPKQWADVLLHASPRSEAPVESDRYEVQKAVRLLERRYLSLTE